jgi:hypothetical protein
MSKTIAILQSNYIPWKGYFDLIAAVDEFVLFDDVQYTRRDWRNRNRVIVDGVARWLTIPVASKGNYDESINSIKVVDRGWAQKHWATLRHSYGKTAFFERCADPLDEAYRRAGTLDYLSEINRLFLDAICALLGVAPIFTRSEQIPRLAATPTGRLVEICTARGASDYLSGPAARAYIERDAFAAASIRLCYADYRSYPVYDQGRSDFEHGVSVLDPLFRCGPEATRAQLKSLRDRASFVRPE